MQHRPITTFLLTTVTTGLLWLLAATTAYAEVSFQYKAPKNAAEKRVQQQLIESGAVETAVGFMNDIFITKQDIVITIGSQYGPVYKLNRIDIPYSFLNEVKARFIKDNYSHSKGNVDNALNDVLIHTLFHEFGHALIEQYELPIVSKEEDAADSLANFLLLHYFDQGLEMVRSAADIFYLESLDFPEFSDEDLWGEHSLTIQRHYNTLCHMYGSDPERYDELDIDTRFDPKRAGYCLAEFNNIAYSWLTLLKPYLIP